MNNMYNNYHTRHLKPNIYDAIWSHTIYKSQHVHYKIVQSYVAYNVSYRIELLSIPYDATKSYATKWQRVYWALGITFNLELINMSYMYTLNYCTVKKKVSIRHQWDISGLI